MAGKPKLFFIPGYREGQLDHGITMKRPLTQTDNESSLCYKIPNYADFLIAYSTIPGFSSWHDIARGSWFMQSFCAELEENGKRYDILTFLTYVNQHVAFNFETNTLY